MYSLIIAKFVVVYTHQRILGQRQVFRVCRHYCCCWYLGRINHCAGCTMGGTPAASPPPINCQIFPTLFWCSNVQCRLKRNDDQKGPQLFGGRKVHPEKHFRGNPGYAYEKRAPVLRWYGASEWLIRPWLVHLSNMTVCLQLSLFRSTASTIYVVINTHTHTHTSNNVTSTFSMWSMA